MGIGRQAAAPQLHGGIVAFYGGGRIIYPPQGGNQSLFRAEQLGIGDFPPAAELQLAQNLLPGMGLLVKINAGGYQHHTLGAVVAGTDAVAQALLFPHILKQLGGHIPAENPVHHLHGGKVLVPVGYRGKKAHAELSLGHLHPLPDVLLPGKLQGRMVRQRPVIPLLKSEHFPEAPGNPLRLGGTHIIELHRAFPADAQIVFQQGLGGDGRHIRHLSHPGNAEGILPAHILEQLADGVDPFVVELRLNRRDLVHLFPLHKIRQEAAVFRGIVKEQILYKGEGLLQNAFPVQGEAVIHHAYIEAGGLVIPRPAGNGAHRRAVELVQPQGDLPQIHGAVGAPEQHTGNQGVHGRLCPVHFPHILNAETILLKPAVREHRQTDAGIQFDSFGHRILLYKQ